ncbi:MAG: glycosyltransferase family 4 protein [Actinomycetota bacterium]
MPSILLVTNDFGPRAGGIETFVMGLLERVPKGEVVVYTSRQHAFEAHDQRWLSEHGVEVIRDKSSILLPTPRVIRNLKKLIRQRNLSKVWFGAAAPLGISARWLRKAGAKQMIALTHGHEVWWSKVWPFSLAISEIARTVDLVSYLGDFTHQAIAPRFADKSKLIKIAPGIDTEHFRPHDGRELRKKYGIENRPTIVSVGRLVHRKGQDRLVEAMPLVLKEVPDAHLVFIGEGPHRKKLDALVDRYKLHNHVTFIGRIQYSDLPLYISLGDIFAMPSRSRLFGLEVEGLGIVYLEASACGLPVVGGDSGGAPDAVKDGITGFVVDGNDRVQIADRICTLLKDEALRRQMGEAGRAWALEEWQWQRWSQAFNRALK